MLKVIGIGNALRGDDAIGPIIIEKLIEEKKDTPAVFIDAGSDAFTVLEHLLEKDPLLIIDCAKMGMDPGDIKLFDVDDASIKEVSKIVSLHGFGFADVYRMGKSIGDVAPCKIIGVEPKTVAFDIHLSDEVKKSIPEILKLIDQVVADVINVTV
jgi:hydrogenase maturation protease